MLAAPPPGSRARIYFLGVAAPALTVNAANGRIGAAGPAWRGPPASRASPRFQASPQAAAHAVLIVPLPFPGVHRRLRDAPRGLRLELGRHRRLHLDPLLAQGGLLRLRPCRRPRGLSAAQGCFSTCSSRLFRVPPSPLRGLGQARTRSRPDSTLSSTPEGCRGHRERHLCGCGSLEFLATSRRGKLGPGCARVLPTLKRAVTLLEALLKISMNCFRNKG
nr:uncharacterized protein LOC127491314 [Oryctolagus cuniculus]